MKLDIRELIDGGPARLRYVFRYSTSRVEHPESVAEHSYFVALYCLFIARWVEEEILTWKGGRPPATISDPHLRTAMQRGDGPVDVQSLLQRALLHDLEEAVSGDVPRSFKHSSPEVKEILDKAAALAFVQVIEPICGNQSPLSKEGSEETEYDPEESDVTDEYICSWLDSKDGTVEGRILEFADYLAVLGFMMQEGAHDGNKIIKRHVAEMNKYFARFESPVFDFIRPLVDQAGVLTREIL